LTHGVRVHETIQALASQPQIVSIAATSFFPMQTGGLDAALLRVERDPSGRAFAGRQSHVSAGFTETLGIVTTSGREILPSEADAISESSLQPGSHFALANAALEKHLAQFGDAVGQIVVLEPSRRGSA
jgi:hypothetical protein